jgi:hypothetical protein
MTCMMDRINHGAAYSLRGGVCTNGADEFFDRMRRLTRSPVRLFRLRRLLPYGRPK